uniref:DUF4138 domain-containing protein n=1 Tax=Yeosuana marina TaxID=1565536 RepID=UPI0030C7D258
LEIKNRSGIDFKVDYLDIYRINGNNRRKASYQRLKQEVLYKYHMPNFIVDEHTERFVYVLPKFVLGDNEKLEIELVEMAGDRKLILK